MPGYRPKKCQEKESASETPYCKSEGVTAEPVGGHAARVRRRGMVRAPVVCVWVRLY